MGPRQNPILIVVVSILSMAVNVPAKSWTIHDIDSTRTGGADGVRLGDVNGDGLKDITTGWESDATVRAYVNPGHSNAGKPWPSVKLGNGLMMSAEDAMFFDINFDGVLDIVVSCEGTSKSVYGLIAPSVADYLNAGSWTVFKFPAATCQWMFASHADLDSDGVDDLIIGSKNRPATASGLGWMRRKAGSRVQASGWEYFDIAPVAWTMEVIPHDIDRDGDIDILFSEPMAVRWVENPGTGAVTKTWARHDILVLTNEGDPTQKIKFISTYDMNKDGRLDIVYPVGWLENATIGGGPVSFRNRPIKSPAQAAYYKSATAADINLDGRPEIVVGTEAYQAGGDPNYPNGVVGMFSLTYNNTVFDTEWRLDTIRSLCSKGFKFDRLELVDFDGDGDLDVATTNERRSNGGQVIWYENPGKSSSVPTSIVVRKTDRLATVPPITASVDFRGCTIAAPHISSKTVIRATGTAARFCRHYSIRDAVP